MKKIAISPFVLLFFCAMPVKSQAPMSVSGVASSLQTLEGANKALLDQQQKTLDALDQLDKAAGELKDFTKRG